MLQRLRSDPARAVGAHSFSSEKCVQGGFSANIAADQPDPRGPSGLGACREQPLRAPADRHLERLRQRGVQPEPTFSAFGGALTRAPGARRGRNRRLRLACANSEQGEPCGRRLGLNRLFGVGRARARGQERRRGDSRRLSAHVSDLAHARKHAAAAGRAPRPRASAGDYPEIRPVFQRTSGLRSAGRRKTRQCSRCAWTRATPAGTPTTCRLRPSRSAQRGRRSATAAASCGAKANPDADGLQPVRPEGPVLLREQV